MCCASTRRSAMRRRSRDIGSRRSLRFPATGAPGSESVRAGAGIGGAGAGAGAASPAATRVVPGAGADSAGAVVVSTGAEASRWASTSALVIRPSLPVPAIAEASRPCSATRRRTAGLRRSGPAAAAGCAEGAAISGTSSSGLAGAPAAPGSIRASTSWLSTVSPVRFRISASTPASGAGTSSTTLSVSSSMRISSLSTASPGCLRHSSSVASGTDSASTGTFTSTVTALSPPVLTRSSSVKPPDRVPARSPPGPAAGWCAR